MDGRGMRMQESSSFIPIWSEERSSHQDGKGTSSDWRKNWSSSMRYNKNRHTAQHIEEICIWYATHWRLHPRIYDSSSTYPAERLLRKINFSVRRNCTNKIRIPSSQTWPTMTGAQAQTPRPSAPGTSTLFSPTASTFLFSSPPSQEFSADVPIFDILGEGTLLSIGISAAAKSSLRVVADAPTEWVGIFRVAE